MQKIVVFFILLSNYFYSQSWSTVGLPNFANNGTGPNTTTDFTFIAVTPNGEPYIIYRDGSNGNKATVKKFDGSNWVIVGNAGFSAGDSYCTTMAFNNSGTPYVAYMDGGDSNKATVKKFDGVNWVSVGIPGLTSGAASFTSIAIDKNGIPFIAFRDVGSTASNSWPNGFRASVMKFDGTKWIYVGTPGFSGGSGPYGASYTSLAIDSNGIIYVAYSDDSNNFKATVMEFDGSSWVNVGSGIISSGQAGNTSIALDNHGRPYVAYVDGANSGKATVMKYNGTNWLPVGTPGFSPGAVDYTSLSIDKNDIPYLVFEDHAQGDRASVMTFNENNWAYAGSVGFSDSMAMYTTIAIDKKNGILYTAYEDVYDGTTLYPKENATVMKYDITTGISAVKTNSSFHVYPNPSSGIITINFSLPTKKESILNVKNALGQSVYSETLKDISGTCSKQIDLSTFPKGIYFAELLSGGELTVQKFILE